MNNRCRFGIKDLNAARRDLLFLTNAQKIGDFTQILLSQTVQ